MNSQESSGKNATQKYSKEADWNWRSTKNKTAELEDAFRQIGTMLNVVGRWNFGAKVLDIQTGLGAVPHLLHDNGYIGVIGTEEDESAAVYWENEEAAIVVPPFELPFADNSFDLVTWFSMHDGRVDESEWEEIIEEMHRVAKSEVVVKPYLVFNAEKDRDFRGWMLGKRFKCTDFVPVLWFYNFVKD